MTTTKISHEATVRNGNGAVPTVSDGATATASCRAAQTAIQQGVIEVQQGAIAIQQGAVQEGILAIQQGAISIQQATLQLQEIPDNGLVLRSCLNGVEVPDPTFHYNRGNALANQGKLDEARVAFERTLELKPDFPEAYKNLADIHLNRGSFDKAVVAYQKALTLTPAYREAENNLGIAFLSQGAYSPAQETFGRLLRRERGLTREEAARFDPGRPAASTAPGGPLSAAPFKLIDRIEQFTYLLARKKIDPSFHGLVDRYEALRREIEADPGRVPYAPLTPRQLEPFSGYYDKLVYYEDAPRLDGPTMNNARDYRALEEEYFHTRALYFDDFLTSAALEELRRYFLNSTVFFRHSEAGFVGSYMTEGFNCSLVYQLVAELRQRFPRVLRDRPLNNMWCYRYGSRGSGVKPHNGDGSVTVNFWLTPDEANMTADGGGGMVMYDKEHPPDWDWLTINACKDDPAVEAQIAAYLADAHSFTIPYRCNRAVLFHSTLFHKTDPFHFRDGYENRRMNITMLFGRRGQESAALR
ncbi:MAG TPA: tetratricopeptide repeat protein [Gemmataceae bacterium]|nr:tetratricopeptide repeat protein [Gemmataceae bacterium]